MAVPMAGNLEFMKHALKEPIPFGWRLASTKDMRDNFELINESIMLQMDEKIHLTDGYWYRGEPHDECRHVLLIGGKPNFKIVALKETEKVIGFGWRFACVKEAKENLDTVKNNIARQGLQIVRLSDGWMKDAGQFERGENKSAKDVLLIETPV